MDVLLGTDLESRHKSSLFNVSLGQGKYYFIYKLDKLNLASARYLFSAASMVDQQILLMYKSKAFARMSVVLELARPN